MAVLLAVQAAPGRAAEDLSVEAERRGERVDIQARALIAAPVAVVWEVLTDYEHLPRFIPGIAKSVVRSRDGGRLLVEQSGEARFFVFSFPIEVQLEVTERVVGAGSDQVLDAMTRQMSAERTRRAVVTEAEGSKQASITVAEGQKQAAILSAEGDRQAAILRAEGFSLALDKIFQVARTLDANTMSLQYLDALKQIGASPSTKFVVPMELAGLLSSVTGLTGKAFSGNGSGSESGAREPKPQDA